MSIVSFDVGIKHLAYCCLGPPRDIQAWNVLNLVAEDVVEPVSTCSLCTRKAVFRHTDICFCKQHATKSKDWMLPVAGLGSKTKKQLEELFVAKGWPVPEGSKDTVLKALQGRMLAAVRPVRKVAAGEVSLIEVGRRMVVELDRVSAGWTVGAVLIENQISPIANRMKTLQGMLTAYFLMRFPSANIHYISSGNKLRRPGEEEKRTYKENKELGIQRCREALQTVSGEALQGNGQGGVDWLAFFEGWPGKKDDLADAYLQGMWWLGKKGRGAVA